MGNGLVTWPCLLLMGFAMRSAWRYLAGLALATAIAFVVYDPLQSLSNELAGEAWPAIPWMLKSLGSPLA